MKTLARIITAVCLVLLMVVVVVNAVNIDIPEGEEPNTAQKILLDVKENITVITGALGVTTTAVVGFLYTIIQKTSTITGDNTALLLADAATNKETLIKIEKTINGVIDENTKQEQKIDMIMDILTETLLLSDLPVSVREKINTAKGAYDGITAQKDKVEQVTEPTEKTAQNVNDGVKQAETKNIVVPRG